MVKGTLNAQSVQEKEYLESRLRDPYPNVAVSYDPWTAAAGEDADDYESDLPEGGTGYEKELETFHEFLQGVRDEWEIRRIARELGRRGGQSRSKKKIRASKRNGRKGGRPRKDGVSPAIGATSPVPLVLVPAATHDGSVEPKIEEWDGSRPGDRQLIRGTRWKLFGENFLRHPSLRSGYFLSDADIALRNSIRSRKAAASRVGRTYDGPEFKVTDEEIKLMPRYKRLKKLYIEEWGEYDES